MSISSHKRQKTLTSTSDPILQSQPSQDESEGEEGKLLPIVEIEPSDRCGICLSEAGNGEVSRGCIDSCNHYYCFVCIMEWAKVESKCPLCKLRFSTIRRPPKPPVFPSERVLHVPLRDQVYDYYGNGSIGPPDPYSEVKCSVCNGITDENLLLLCDLCDSAAHTYCVGLGVTVPEGDWFCQDCALLRDEHLKSESNNYSGFQISFGTVHKISSTNEHVTVSDIVQESRGHEVQRSRSASSDPCSLPCPSSAHGEITIINNINQSSSTSAENVARRPTKPNTRTLQHCRNLHGRIRVLRENWNSYRSGVSCFSSRQSDSNIIFSQKSSTLKSGQPSVSCLNKKSIAQCSSNIKNDIGTHDIQKAWQMMDKAKSIKQRRSNIVRQASKCQIRKLKAVENAHYARHRHLSAESRQNGSKNVGNMLPGQNLYCSLEKDFYEQPSLVSGKGKGKDVYYHSKGSISGHSPMHQELKLSKGVQTPSYMIDAVVGSEKLPAEITIKGPDCSSLAAASEPTVLNNNQVKGANHASSSHSKEKHPKETSKLEKFLVGSQQYNDAKSEIQSLVKLNLKLQTKREKLDVVAFKEVARAATHCILAACGLEHPRPACTSIPGFVCPHLHNFNSLMPKSCRECFYVFVKDVVNNVLLHKKR